MKFSIKDFFNKCDQITFTQEILNGKNYEFIEFYPQNRFFKKLKRFIAYTALKLKFSIKAFFSKCDQIRRKLPLLSHLLKKSLMENFIFCAVTLFRASQKKKYSKVAF